MRAYRSSSETLKRAGSNRKSMRMSTSNGLASRTGRVTSSVSNASFAAECAPHDTAHPRKMISILNRWAHGPN
eukprot:COSAG05_NODE_602_length_8420_cov_13.540199_4_plen_73_part_00